MSRLLDKQKMQLLRVFSSKAAKIEADFNDLVREADEIGIYPDVSINIRNEDRRPVVKIWFFKDSDSIQS